MEKYNDFIKNVELLDVNVEKIACDKRISYQECEHGLKINMEPEFELKEIVDDFLRVLAVFHLVCHEEKDEKSTVFEIHTTFELLYSIDGTEVSEEVIERFIDVNVPVNVWPYGRELISSLTTRMGFPALIIGTYKTVR